MYHNHNRFTARLGPPGWAGARRELLNFMVQGKINRGRHTDQPAECHSIWTNQWPPPSSPHFLQARCPSCHPTNSVKALKAMETCNNIQFKHSLNIMHIATDNATMHSTHHQLTHTQPFYGPFSGTTQVSRCQKRTSGLYGARDD